jgi:hypothetical protein
MPSGEKAAMRPIEIALFTLALMLAGAALGALLRRSLPKHHLNDHAKDIVRLGTGLVATIAALVLGLLINSAASSYEAQRHEVRHMAANIILLDQLLERYGPEARSLRESLRAAIDPLVTQLWADSGDHAAGAHALQSNSLGARAFLALHDLTPQDTVQRSLQGQALRTAIDVQRSRLMLFERSHTGLPIPFLAILVSWLTMIFVSFCLFTPLNPTSMVALLVIALSAAGAIFLILEMNQPFSGTMQISDESLRTALAPLEP